MAEEGLLDLADVLARLGGEFQRAAQVSEPTIQWYGGTVELQTVVTKDADGRIRFWVVDAGGGASHQHTIKVTVSIAPYGGEPMAAGH